MSNFRQDYKSLVDNDGFWDRAKKPETIIGKISEAKAMLIDSPDALELANLALAEYEKQLKTVSQSKIKK